MRHLLAGIRHAPAQFAGIFVALAAAAAMVTWAFSLGATGSSARPPAQRLAGAAVLITGPSSVSMSYGHGPDVSADKVPLASYRRVPAGLTASLASVPGVRAAVADQSIPLALRLSGGQVITGTSAEPVTGHGWQSAQLTPLRLSAGQAPARAGQIVIGAALARSGWLRVGDQVSLAGQPLPPFTVTGIATAPAGSPAADGAVYFTTQQAAALYGHPGQADLIGIMQQPGTALRPLIARLRTAVASQHLSVVAGTDRGLAEDPGAASDLANLSALGGAAGTDLVLISLFVVASTVALSVAGRARAVALLRAVGATPGQIRRSLMIELAGLGIIAGLIGYLPGCWLAGLSVRGMAAHQFIPAGTRAWTSPVELLPAIGAAVVVAELAGLLAARRASRIRPAAALEEASIERRYPRPLRLLLGLAALAGGVVLSIVALREHDASQQLNDALFGLLAFLSAIAFLGPYLIAVTELVLRLPLRLAGGPAGRLAAAMLRARSRRMAAAAIAIALPVCFAGAVVTIDATQAHAGVTEGRERLAASMVVTAPGPGLSPSAVTFIRSQPGVTGAVGLVPTTVYLPWQGTEEQAGDAVTPGQLGSVLRLHVTSGSLAGFGPGDIALSQLVAGQGAMNTRVGRTITSYLADGTPYRAKVTAIFSRSLGFADVIVPAGAAGGGHLGATALGQVLVSTTPGGHAAVHIDALASRYQGLQAASRDVVNAQYQKLTSQTSYLNDLLLALIAVLCAVALVNTLIMATLQGREELGLLRRAGATTGQQLAMTAWQAAVVTCT
ncbi:MAG TPA: FtsX-like permease family protein, partial [Streptosporangiaceae bacterium]